MAHLDVQAVKQMHQISYLGEIRNCLGMQRQNEKSESSAGVECREGEKDTHAYMHTRLLWVCWQQMEDRGKHGPNARQGACDGA